MTPSLIVGIILYGGVVGCLLGVVALFLYMLIESRGSRGSEGGVGR
ncbi:MAG: hypothetical protein QXS42_05750 [Zestosphaera sp.]